MPMLGGRLGIGLHTGALYLVIIGQRLFYCSYFCPIRALWEFPPMPLDIVV
jgi:hypothetical protein